MGTGNDTARAFGWGHKFPGKKGVVRNLQRMRTAPVVTFDRWHATVDHYNALSEAQVEKLPAAMHEMKEEPTFLGYRAPDKRKDDPQYQAVAGAGTEEQKAPATNGADGTVHAGAPTAFLPDSALRDSRRSSASTVVSIQLPAPEGADAAAAGPVVRRDLQFNNYLSFGIDAQIQFEFHEHREANRHLYVSRVVNMAWTTYWGAVNMFCCRSRDLSVKVEVPDLDTGEWREMVIPPNIRSLVLLNGTTYAAGRHIWGTGKSRADEYSGPPPSYNDGAAGGDGHGEHAAPGADADPGAPRHPPSLRCTRCASPWSRPYTRSSTESRGWSRAAYTTYAGCTRRS